MHNAHTEAEDPGDLLRRAGSCRRGVGARCARAPGEPRRSPAVRGVTGRPPRAPSGDRWRRTCSL